MTSKQRSVTDTSNADKYPLAGISLTNFKTYAAMPPVALAPLTLLTGPNSSGKSSVVQALVLLKQTLENRLGSHVVLSDLVNLGTFDRLYCTRGPARARTISIAVDLRVAGQSLEGIRGDFELDATATRVILDFRARNDMHMYVHAFTLELVRPDHTSHPVLTIKARRNNTYHLKLFDRNFEKKIESTLQRFQIRQAEVTDVAFHGIIPVSAELSGLPPATEKGKRSTKKDAQPKEYSVPFGLLHPFLHWITDQAQLRLGRRLLYLGPLRAEPSRFYEKAVRGIGPRGEDTLSFLNENRSRPVKGVGTGHPARLLDSVNHWMRHISLAEGITLNELDDLHFDVKVNDRYLPEVGCGVGQLLPAIVLCLSANPGETVLLEQPEIHLHQSLQAAVCDFFIAQMRRGVQVILETHSEVMIQRLRRRIAEDTSEELHKQVRIFFTSGQEGKIEEITIDSMGNASSWPRDFFDQILCEAREIVRAQAERTQKSTRPD